MDNNNEYKRNEKPSTPLMNNFLILDINDCYNCTKCSSSAEILSINDKDNSITFKCLNPITKNNHNIQTVSISEYINSMKKNTYFYSQCYICKKLQNQSKNIPIFSYCIKCDKIICDDCINEHLKLNEKNHKNMSKEFIIKNNEKEIKCLMHPTEKNIAFCFDCNTHLCHKCLKNEKHIMHRKKDLIEVKPTEMMNKKLNEVINIYKEKIILLKKEKKNKESELYNKLIDDNKKIKEDCENKIKEIKKELIYEVVKNEKMLNDDLNKLKINYENKIKLRKNKYNIILDNLNKKYKKLEKFYNFKLNEELEKIKKKYNEALNKLEDNKEIKNNENLLLINSMIKNTQKIYEDNYYNNNKNINNILCKCYKSEDFSVQKLFNDEDKIHNQLIFKEKEKRRYKLKDTEIEKLKNEKSEKINIIKIIKDEIEKLKNERIEKIKTINNEVEDLENKINEKVITINDELEKLNEENRENINKIKREVKKLKIEARGKIKSFKNEIKKFKNEKPEKYICKIQTEKYKGFGYLSNIPNPVLIIPDNILIKQDIEIGKEITILLNNDKIIKKIKIDENRNINIIDKSDGIEVNIIIIELNKNDEGLEKKNFLKLEIFEIVNQKNEIILTLNIEKNDIDEPIYFLDNTENNYYENEKEVEHYHDNLSELNENNTNLYINNKKVIFKKYFIPKEIGTYEIKLEFKINLKNCAYMFFGCDNITKINLSFFNTQNVTNMSYMFGAEEDIGYSSLTTLDLSSFNTENVTNMQNMFENCSKLKFLNLKSFKTDNVTKMQGMFEGCSSLTLLDLSSFNTENVTNMAGMFNECNSLKKLDLSSFNTENVDSMFAMFCKCFSLTSLNLSSFNTEKVNDMKYMFQECYSLTILNLSSFDTYFAIAIDMFDGCHNLFSCGSNDKKILYEFNNK